MTEFTCKRCVQVFQSSEALKSHQDDRISCLEYAIAYLSSQNERLLNILIKSYNLVNDKISDVDEKVDKEIINIGFRIDDLEGETFESSQIIQN